MKNPETQALRRALTKVRRQNNKEKAEILKPFLEMLDLSISSDMLFFSKDDPESIFPLPLDNNKLDYHIIWYNIIPMIYRSNSKENI